MSFFASFFERIRADYVCLRGALRALKLTMPIGRNPTRIFPDAIDDLAAKFGDAPALLSDRESFTYRQLGERANRYARWALRENIGKSETVCLLMPNRPEYMAIWIGVTHAGGVVALLNTNLVGPSLAHCIDIVEAKHIIVASELLQAYESIKPFLKAEPKAWLHGAAASGLPRIDSEIDGISGAPLTAAERRPLTVEDRALFIYTSGTTGLPKAANINHYRIMLASLGFAGVMNTRASDRMYDCLPMYHTTGGVVATGALLMVGGSVFIRERFSASQFWEDIVRNECTIFQYIGELCRYLVNSPPGANDTRHRLRLACGNGLRPDVWSEFKRRFAIPQILEFYAATEGNVQMFNFEGKPGAVGRIPWFLAHRFPVSVVRFDVEKEMPVRDARGFCIPCDPDETGEVIGKIVRDPARPGGRFEGYARKEEDEKKILRDVFEKGDAYFRTGDLMRKDRNGYYYFVDRVGDTFRWKGENVSTSEVAEAISRFPGIQEANVYGVDVPGNEGRAGMAAIVCGKDCDLGALKKHIADRLPEYARPLFLRLRQNIEVTATFKQKKVELKREGYDPTLTADPLFFDDPREKAFVPIDRPLFDLIRSGKIRL